MAELKSLADTWDRRCPCGFDDVSDGEEVASPRGDRPPVVPSRGTARSPDVVRYGGRRPRARTL
eukprot:4985735-Lingulodinium_polyedra.AAC.1